MEEASKALLGRLHALANAQNLVAGEGGPSVPLRDLADTQLAAFGPQVLIDGEPLVVENGFAQSFALIVHELATNAVKYGSLSAQQGTVTLGWSVVFTAEGRHLKLSWTERGGPPPPTKVTPGFGSALLSMYGYAVTELTENGIEYALMVPLCNNSKANTSPRAESVTAGPKAPLGQLTLPEHGSRWLQKRRRRFKELGTSAGTFATRRSMLTGVSLCLCERGQSLFAQLGALSEGPVAL